MDGLYKYLSSISPIQASTWGLVKDLFTETRLNKGDYFLEEGVTARKIGFLKDGVIRAFYRNGEGSEYNKHFFTSNNLVGGYSSLVTKTPNKIYLQALTDCQLLTANYHDLIMLYDDHPDFERFGRRLAEMFFVHKEEREVNIVMLGADKRYLIFQRQFPNLEQLIPQYHIASYLGITPTQLSRIRRKFSKK
ncbi:Crp/Fnr family transcriptional regulator [Sphingobacterium gobiense]|uniref:Crp/Fnr family transcriptional regulator n=1 Tax=Sphingobacterium gobiense TaxID=1382456 RepID=A0A2S9JG92_9SPHI|nr:Crp/Fnr family transcriptional regulator [Sphingobacterium gobiense]PRD51963.1 Crp/Fnr family transcriptional regulator [Sphingobacterium gobiense]